MRISRALFASLGASITIIAAVAFLLLSVSAVVAIQGWPGVGTVTPRPPLVLGANDSIVPAGVTAADGPVVLASRSRHRTTARAHAAGRAARHATRPVSRVAVRPTVVATAPPSVVASAPKPAPDTSSDRPVTAVHRVVPQAGDAVRSLGKGLSATVTTAGDDVAAPLAPPVEVTVQNVTKLLALLLSRTTGLLAGALDNLLPHTGGR